MIHGFDLFSDTIEESYRKFRQYDFERDSWKTSSRTDIEKSLPLHITSFL